MPSNFEKSTIAEAIAQLSEVVDYAEDLSEFKFSLKILMEDIHAKLDQVSIVWSVEDILIHAERNNISITREDAALVLNVVANDHDCNQGITWAIIDEAIRGYNNG